MVLRQFDGVRFRVFDKSNTAGITANRFAVMVQGKEGSLVLYRKRRNHAIIAMSLHTFGDVEGSVGLHGYDKREHRTSRLLDIPASGIS